MFKYKIVFLSLVFTILTINTNGQGLLSKDSEEVFSVVEDMPIPWFYKTECLSVSTDEKMRCYQNKLTEYLFNNMKYPVKAIANKTEGTVVIQFVISTDGSIKDAEIVKDIGDGCGAVALDLVENMPNWVPGRQRGKPVNVRYTLPVKFKLNK